MPQLTSVSFLATLIIVVYFLSIAVFVLREYERGVVFRLGRLKPVKGPGLVFIIPLIDRLVRISLRTITIEVPVQDVITKDNVSVQVSAVVYFRVLDPNKSVTEIEDYNFATSQISQTTLRSVLGQSSLDELLAKRDELNTQLEKIIDEQTEPWGVEVTHVEVKNVDLPHEMQRAIARQAEAERERRAKIIHAQGEHQAAAELANAAAIIRTEPIALQLRYLQTMSEMATESKATVVAPIPLPMDIIKPFMEQFKKGSE